MIQIQLQGRKQEVKEATRICDLAMQYDGGNLLCGAFVDNVDRSLLYKLYDGCDVRFFDLKTDAGRRIYENTNIFVFARAFKTLFPDQEPIMRYSLGGGIYCEFNDGTPMTEMHVRALKDAMQDLIKKDVRIRQYKYGKEKIRELCDRGQCNMNLALLEQADCENVTVYELDGYFAFFFSKLLMHTAQIYVTNLIPYDKGCVLLGVDYKKLTRVKEFEEQRNLHEELRNYEKWCEDLGVYQIADLNNSVKDSSIVKMITVAEAHHERLIGRIADTIYEQRETKRIVLISGPSSAGKTTTSKRLRTHLNAMGLHPVSIELDNYFVDREKTPRGKDGKYDFECLEAVDVELFNKNLIQLMQTGSAKIPSFDFKSGRRREQFTEITVDENSPIIIEGIHGLNEKLTVHIPKEQKFKIYVNDLTHINFDDLNRIPTSDIRLIRRIVRDNMNRGHDAVKTIEMWDSVREGEIKNIFPYSNVADVVFNTSLFYELSALKKYAEPLLKQITQQQPCYYEARRLLNILRYFEELHDEEAIYSSSILREFIGGNVFERL